MTNNKVCVVGRNCIADANVTTAGLRVECSVHTNHLATQVYQWPPRIAWIDDGIGLNVFVERRLAQVSDSAR